MIRRIKAAIERHKNGPELVLNARYRVIHSPGKQLRRHRRDGHGVIAVSGPYRVEQYISAPRITTNKSKAGSRKAWVTVGYHATRKQAAIHHNQLATRPTRQEIVL